MDDSTFEKKYNTIGMDIIQTHQMFCQEVLKLLPGQMAVVSNGRVSKKTVHFLILHVCSLPLLELLCNAKVMYYITFLLSTVCG